MSVVCCRSSRQGIASAAATALLLRLLLLRLLLMLVFYTGYIKTTRSSGLCFLLLFVDGGSGVPGSGDGGGHIFVVVAVYFFYAFNCFFLHDLPRTQRRCTLGDTWGRGKEEGRELLQSPPHARMRFVHDLGLCTYVSALGCESSVESSKSLGLIISL